MLRFGADEHERSPLTPILTAAAVIAITVARPPRRRDTGSPGAGVPRCRRTVRVVERHGPGSGRSEPTDRPDPSDGPRTFTQCDIGSENARLVTSTTGAGRTVEHWTVDGADSHADLVIENGATSGGGGCGPMSRAIAYPQVPWTNDTLSVDPRDGTGLGHFTFFGQAPAETVAVDIVTTVGPSTSRSSHPTATSWSSPISRSNLRRRPAPRRMCKCSNASTPTQQTAPCSAMAVGADHPSQS